MSKPARAETILTLLIVSVLSVAFNVRSVTASGNVVGSWHFDEGEGIIAYDSSGYLNDGTIHGATWTTYGARAYVKKREEKWCLVG